MADDVASRWLDGLSDDFHGRLAKTGLVAPRAVVKVWTLGEIIPTIIKEKSADIKQATMEVYGQAEKSLYRYFGEGRQVDTITSADAKEFCKWLEKNGRLKKPGALAQATVAKRIQHVFSFFHAMKENGDISCNPFKGLSERATVDERRNAT